FAGITIDHGPKQRGQHEKDADYAEDNGRVGEEKDFDQNKNHSEHEKGDDFPTGEPGEIMSGKEKRETDRGDDPRHAHARHFEFEISADDPEQQKQGRE